MDTKDKIFAWLARGEVGISSRAMALTTAGVNLKRLPGWWSPWPHDPDDLRRCVLLVDLIPETREQGIAVLAQRYPEWKALAENWDDLVATLRREIGDELQPVGSAKETYDKMDALLEPLRIQRNEAAVKKRQEASDG